MQQGGGAVGKLGRVAAKMIGVAKASPSSRENVKVARNSIDKRSEETEKALKHYTRRD